MCKKNKQSRFYKAYSGEYGGIPFEIVRRKMDKTTYKNLKKKLGRRPKSKIEYVYSDSDVGSRYLTKSHYDNLLKNSDFLYDDKNGKCIRH